ncbi:hypothetical protein D9757_001236 [Collybiopsis confluens]|uniref:Tyrosine specific protein phosphatases domain-containing protein n=1 Tax=Collybiopsis confluens TaxID=2823264 RepID=A0A8H5I1Q6_9AGAR|nr:hypothetical protein D9757_001236 [Collybiopsis confluens]
MKDLEPIDPEVVNDLLSKYPFVSISGVINVRDLGGYSSITHPGKCTKSHFIYRSAEVAGITEEGKQQLHRLGIHKVFDLRSDTEIAKYNSPPPTIDGVELNHIPVFKTEDYSPEMMAKRYQLYASGTTEAFMELYSQILDHGGPAFGAILRWIRDNPNDACIFHCTAGKDRTGILAALILKLVGVDDTDISNDYSLTRIGREPARAKIMERLSKEPIFASNNEAALVMFTCRPETMLALLNLLQTKYGGVEEYVKRYAYLSDSDITTIQSNLLVPSDSHL